MSDDIGTAANWSKVSDYLRDTTEIPAIRLRGAWVNRPPVATPQRGRFELAHLTAGRWLLDEPPFAAPAGDPAWVGTPAGIIAAPDAWFTTPAETSAVELPGREVIAGRVCSRLQITFSRHSHHRMTLWLDEDWPLVLAARTEVPGAEPRFDVRVTELTPLTGEELLGYEATALSSVS